MNNRGDLKLRVKAALNLVEFIGRELELKQVGETEWKALCPFHSEKSASFTVFGKNGVWGFHCFGCEASGDVFEWIMRRKGLSFPQALVSAANDAGISMDEPARRIYQPPEVMEAAKSVRGTFDPDQYRALTEKSAAFCYLTEQRRLPAELLADYSVGETVDGLAYAFAYKWRSANWPVSRKPFTEFCKVVMVARPEGKKVEWRDPKGGKSILFGMGAELVETAAANHGDLVICEGEIDAITWAQYGYAAVSVPGGAKSTGWIDACWDWLERFAKIHISFDEDAAGRMKVVEIVKRLGMARTDIIRLPLKGDEHGSRFKDINECLQAEVVPAAIAQCVAVAEILKPEKLKDIYEFEQAIWQKFHPDGTDQVGLTLPWGNYHGSNLPFRFRYGEVTVWTGFNKHGKSEVLNHCIIGLCWQGDKALICSLEVSAPETYRKLIRMTQAKRMVCSVEDQALFRERCLKPLSQKIWVYDAVGTASIEDVRQVMLYAYQRYGCRQFVLDSLMRFTGLDGEGQEIWNAQKNFMDQLLDFARTYNVHIHLVAHSKKPNDRRGEAIIPRRYDVMGSSYITNLAFNVIVVWRNRTKQDKLEEIFQQCSDLWISHKPGLPVPQWKRLLIGGPKHDAGADLRECWKEMLDTVEQLPGAERAVFQALVPEPDAYFIVDAQRGGDGDCPARHLWFHSDSLQFLEISPWNPGQDPRSQPTQYAAQSVANTVEES
jgi:twinkle protein